ncbi:MAG: M64 family metallopeptidase [Syntrophotaleaceae bacterium]
MGAADGTILGATKILDHGPDGERFTIPLVAEGFTQAQQDLFNTRCDELKEHLLQHPDLSPVMGAVNLYRVNIASSQSGADDPSACPEGTGAVRSTYFDATYCGDGEIRRTLIVDDELVTDVLNEMVPLWLYALVIVNDNKGGGTGGEQVGVVDLSGDWRNVAVHELGHTAFGLGDEYGYLRAADADEPAQNQHSGDEPSEPNLTAVTDRSLLKWRHLVPAHIPVPTQQNPDCTTVGPDSNPLTGDDAEATGLFEGAGQFHCGLYRPAYECIMREGKRFCAVCREVIYTRLRSYLPPAPILKASPPLLDLGTVSLGWEAVGTVELLNPGQEPVTGVELELDNPNFLLGSHPETVEPGESVPVEIILIPQFLSGEVNATLQIFSSAPEVSVAVRAAVCIGRAALQLEVDGEPYAPLDLGLVVQGLTMYRSFTVMNLFGNDNFDCGAEVEVILPPLPAPFFYAQLPPGGAMRPDGSYVFVIPPPGIEGVVEVQVLVGFTALETGEGLVTTDVEVRTDAENYDILPLTLKATVIPPPPIDAVLVLDRSGSMGDPVGIGDRTRRQVAVEAAGLFVGMLRENQRVGIVRFNQQSENPGDVLLDLADVGGDSQAQAWQVLESDALDPQGDTAIGEGMITGSDVLAGAAVEKRALVVLTDGRQNTGIGIEEARQTIAGRVPPQRVYAVGIGLDQYQREVGEIATANGGAAFVTGELTGSREFLLHKLYAQILADLGGGSLIRDPQLVLRPGARHRTDIEVCGADREVQFIVVCRPTAVHPKYMRVWLETPGGRMIDPSLAQANPGFAFRQHGSHLIFRASRIDPEDWAGVWTIWVANAAAPGSRADLFYSVIAAARVTGLLLPGRLIQNDYKPGSPMTALFEPRLHGLPVSALPGARLRLERPDGEVSTLPLTETAPGSYRAEIEDTFLVGAYDISALFGFRVEKGCRSTRFRQLTGVILPGGERDEFCRAALKSCLERLGNLDRGA